MSGIEAGRRGGLNASIKSSVELFPLINTMDEVVRRGLTKSYSLKFY